MAMYNFSQAMGVGKMTTIDWKSIENANMATLTFKQTLIDLGVALGKLKKAEDGLTYLVDDKGIIDKNTQVTAENLRETLQKKWVDKDVLLAALSVYSGEYSAEELKQLYNIMDEDSSVMIERMLMIAPEMMPFFIRGIVILAKVFMLEAPRLSDASSSDSGMLCRIRSWDSPSVREIRSSRCSARGSMRNV